MDSKDPAILGLSCKPKPCLKIEALNILVNRVMTMMIPEITL